MRSSSTMMRSFIVLRYLGAIFKAKHPLLGDPPDLMVWPVCMITSTNIPFKSLRLKEWEHVCSKNNAPALSRKEYKCLLFIFLGGKVLSCFKTLETFTLLIDVCNDSVAWWVESRWGAHGAGCQGSSPDCYLVPGRNFIKWEFVDCVRQERFILNWHAGYKLTDTH